MEFEEIPRFGKFFRAILTFKSDFIAKIAFLFLSDNEIKVFRIEYRKKSVFYVVKIFTFIFSIIKL